MKISKNRILVTIFLIILCLQSFGLFSQVTPKKADSFVESMGINIKLDRERYKRSDGFNTTVKPAVQDLGMHHIRSAHFTHGMYGPQNRQLWEDYGTRALFVTGSYEGGQTPQNIRSQSNAAADFIYAVEGQNEPDIFLIEGYGWPYQQYTDRNGNSFTNTRSNYQASRAYHQDMVYYLDNDPKAKDLLVATTPMAFGNNVSKILPVTHDLESFHHYSHRSVVTTNLDNTINQTHGYAQGGTPKPMLLSEFGWKTGGSNSVTEKTQAKNILVGFCEYFNRGIKVSYIHELIHNDWGIIKTDGSRKPAFKAIKEVIELLEEATFNISTKKWMYPSFTPKALDYQVLNANGSTHKLLLQKSSGVYFLLLWQDVDRSNDNGTDKSISDDAVAIEVNGNLRAASQFRFNNSFDLVENDLSINNSSINVNVPDNLVIIRLEVAVSDADHKIENLSNGKVIRADLSGSNVVQHIWNNWDSQKWKFEYLESGFYRIRNKSTNKFLQASDSRSDGVPIVQNTWKNWNIQQWKLVYLGNGYYRIENKAHGKCLRASWNEGDNAPITQHSWNNWNSQTWKLVNLSSSARQSAQEEQVSLELEDFSSVVNVYPNPTNKSLWINYPSDTDGTIQMRVTDLSGKSQLQISAIFKSGINELEINVDSLKNGVYLLILDTKEGLITRQFIVSK